MTARTLTVRHDVRPGDVVALARAHGAIYAREHGFDHTFEAYVAGPLADFARSPSRRQRIWIVEENGRLAGCIAIVEQSEDIAQLRWFLVDPDFRGAGLGTRLLDEAVAFSRACGYRSVILWTVSTLTAAARRYRAAGFRRVAEHARRLWGVDLVEEKYELALS